MNIKEKISKRNCYVGENRPVYIVIHETDNYSNGAGAERHSAAQYNGNLGKASVHYYVDDKEIYKCLNHNDGAWSVGDGYGKYGITNKNSINIEMCVNPDSDYSKARENTIELTKYLMKELGIGVDKVVRHYDASRKKCPRKMMDNPSLWVDFKARLSGDSNTIINTEIPTSSTEKRLWEVSVNGEEVKTLQRELNIQFNKDLKVDGHFGESTLNACILVRIGANGNITRCIQQRLINRGYNLSPYYADGRFGERTYNAICNLQRNKGLSIDGIVGKDTWKALYSL